VTRRCGCARHVTADKEKNLIVLEDYYGFQPVLLKEVRAEKKR
jgi:hypothetical protein